ncbi:DUF2336 domain-containing protein [Sphingomonas alba]|uniref:DUF2336 domain-containing protein n=1 Tax=Sphingomonas alba TaxID=2908208 RepID=A0ABT0RIE0_9SPHN|nr:DUF2336 domain-containing protein [Sphingomonas alba]MCL6682399.1 DUF2336 domain-containing protein [Sphingomonas alba]
MASVRRDFFLDPAYRLTEQERALMTAMLHDLVGTVAAEILAAAPGKGEPAPDGTALASRLHSAGLLDREALVAMLLRRADEHRIGAAFAGRAGPRKLPLLPRLVGDSDAGVAAAAMTLVVARGRRRDAFGQPRIELADLPRLEATSLAFAVAATLGDDFAEAAQAAVAGHLPDEALDAAVAALADALEAAGRLDDRMIEAAAEDGEASLLAGLLARRASISADTAWGYLVGGQEDGLALLGRLAGLSRPTAARLIAEFGLLSGASVEDEIGRFDSLADKDVSAARHWWGLPAGYRAARTALGLGRG